jgi:hypothetical protein
MIRIAVAAVAVLALAGGLAFWAYDRGDDSAEAQVQEVRWFNVTVAIPEGSPVYASPGFWEPEGTPPAMFIRSRDGDSVIVIDAETGKVIEDLVQPKDRAAVDEVLKTVAVSPLDRSAAPWPYNGEPRNVKREGWGKITFIPPDRASGITIEFSWEDDVGWSGTSMRLTNGRSSLSVDADTGTVIAGTTRILPEDKEAFGRLLSTVEYVGP